MSIKLLVFTMTSFASKTLVYLATVLLPLQPLSAVACGCDSHGRHDVDANIRLEQAKAVTGCCGRAERCRCSSHSQTGSCCTKTREAPAKSCCGNGNTCSCRTDDSSPPVPQVPAQSRSQSVNDVAQPLLPASMSTGDPEAHACLVSADRPSGASGLARCIVLCRFRL